MLQSKKFEDFEEEASQYRNILLEYKRTGKKFVDKNFHPTLKVEESRIYIDDSPESWKRVENMYKVPLFQEDLISPDFIKQGELGDCYFIASLSRIARQSYLVPAIFDTATPNQILGRVRDTINIKCGAVVIYFNCFGLKTPVLIDTFLPLKYDQLQFSSPINENVSPWFCLVEKAYAKLYGSYSNIIGGTLPYAIYNLFGYYPTNKKISEMKSSEKVSKLPLFKRILKYQEQGAVMGAAISYENLPKGVTQKDVEDKGLIAGHCYLLIKAREACGKKFLCLRNPWGGHEWNGDWSDSSSLWTPQLEKELKMVKAEDGTFWMSDSDFFKYFTEIEVSKPFPPEWYLKRFYYQLTPGDHDGYNPETKNANFLNRPNFAFQVTQPIAKGEKCRFHILVEKHHELFDKKKGVLYSPPQFCVYLVENKGKKVNYENIRYCSRFMMRSNSDLFSFAHEVEGNDVILTIVLQRLQKCNLVEDCYVLVFCDHEFKLYDIDHPEDLIENEENPGIVFKNFTSMLPDAKKQFRLKFNPNDLPLGQSVRPVIEKPADKKKEDKRKKKPGKEDNINNMPNGNVTKLNEGDTNKNKPNENDNKSKLGEDEINKNKPKENDNKSKLGLEETNKNTQKENDQKNKPTENKPLNNINKQENPNSMLDSEYSYSSDSEVREKPKDVKNSKNKPAENINRNKQDEDNIRNRPVESPNRNKKDEVNNRNRPTKNVSKNRPMNNNINKQQNNSRIQDAEYSHSSDSDIRKKQKDADFNPRGRNDNVRPSHNDDDDPRAKDQEIRRLTEKLKSEERARQRAEEEVRKMNSENEHLKSLLGKAKKQLREKESEQSNHDKKERELNRKLEEVNRMKRHLEREKKSLEEERRRLQSERLKSKQRNYPLIEEEEEEPDSQESDSYARHRNNDNDNSSYGSRRRNNNDDADRMSRYSRNSRANNSVCERESISSQSRKKRQSPSNFIQKNSRLYANIDKYTITSNTSKMPSPRGINDFDKKSVASDHKRRGRSPAYVMRHMPRQKYLPLKVDSNRDINSVRSNQGIKRKSRSKSAPKYL
ncbi:hypothetical protein M9Y10_031060 [Tritrichomonas musculus]|uniref:Calpain catalytic domain-containing protein n=1 Tax=Tritrichomonas musculus TaxID=1915356 RepID=A0ABR2H3G6_9EUKA